VEERLLGLEGLDPMIGLGVRGFTCWIRRVIRLAIYLRWRRQRRWGSGNGDGNSTDGSTFVSWAASLCPLPSSCKAGGGGGEGFIWPEASGAPICITRWFDEVKSTHSFHNDHLVKQHRRKI
jgi:hypothetical protein